MSKKSYHHGDLPNALLNAANLELSSKGIEAFSMRGVAKRAGVSHAAPAHHFGDAKGVLNALAAAGFNSLLLVDADYVPHEDPREELKEAASEYIDFVEKNSELSKLMFFSQRLDWENEDLGNARDSFFSRFVALVEDLPEAKGQSDEEVMIAVIAAWSMVHGFSDLINSERLPKQLVGFKPDRKWLMGAFIDQLIGGQG
ncbi:MAG: TetR/AcrR family transcriptional regulator [Alphaproteobacteria bacterium]